MGEVAGEEVAAAAPVVGAAIGGAGGKGGVSDPSAISPNRIAMVGVVLTICVPPIHRAMHVFPMQARATEGGWAEVALDGPAVAAGPGADAVTLVVAEEVAAAASSRWS